MKKLKDFNIIFLNIILVLKPNINTFFKYLYLVWITKLSFHCNLFKFISNNLYKPNIILCLFFLMKLESNLTSVSERRWSNRRFSYGYLVTTSPQLLNPLWRVAILAFPLRMSSIPMVWRAVSTRPGNVFTVALLIHDY